MKTTRRAQTRQKNDAPEGRTRGGRAVMQSPQSLKVAGSFEQQMPRPGQPPKRIRNHGETPSPHVATPKMPLSEARSYPRTASFRALAARRRTTVFALILIAS